MAAELPNGADGGKTGCSTKEKASLPPSERYSVEKQIGKGSYGVAWTCKDKTDGSKCVLKKVRLARQNHKERQASLQELLILSNVHHRNILRYITAWVENGCTSCMVVELCACGDLSSQLRARHATQDSFQEIHLHEMLVQLASGLDFLHKNCIAHRDFKSGNIFITEDGCLKIADFGLADLLATPSSKSTLVVGTPNYMSPELLKDRPYGTKNDIWALGCVMFEATALKPAFNAFNMEGLIKKITTGPTPQLPSQYSEEWRELIKAMLSRDEEMRPSAGQILALPWLQPAVRRVEGRHGPAIPPRPDGRPGSEFVDIKELPEPIAKLAAQFRQAEWDAELKAAQEKAHQKEMVAKYAPKALRPRLEVERREAEAEAEAVRARLEKLGAARPAPAPLARRASCPGESIPGIPSRPPARHSPGAGGGGGGVAVERKRASIAGAGPPERGVAGPAVGGGGVGLPPVPKGRLSPLPGGLRKGGLPPMGSETGEGPSPHYAPHPPHQSHQSHQQHHHFQNGGQQQQHGAQQAHGGGAASGIEGGGGGGAGGGGGGGCGGSSRPSPVPPSGCRRSGPAAPSGGRTKRASDTGITQRHSIGSTTANANAVAHPTAVGPPTAAAAPTSAAALATAPNAATPNAAGTLGAAAATDPAAAVPAAGSGFPGRRKPAVSSPGEPLVRSTTPSTLHPVAPTACLALDIAGAATATAAAEGSASQQPLSSHQAPEGGVGETGVGMGGGSIAGGWGEGNLEHGGGGSAAATGRFTYERTFLAPSSTSLAASSDERDSAEAIRRVPTPSLLNPSASVPSTTGLLLPPGFAARIAAASAGSVLDEVLPGDLLPSPLQYQLAASEAPPVLLSRLPLSAAEPSLPPLGKSTSPRSLSPRSSQRTPSSKSLLLSPPQPHQHGVGQSQSPVSPPPLEGSGRGAARGDPPGSLPPSTRGASSSPQSMSSTRCASSPGGNSAAGSPLQVLAAGLQAPLPPRPPAGFASSPVAEPAISTQLAGARMSGGYASSAADPASSAPAQPHLQPPGAHRVSPSMASPRPSPLLLPSGTPRPLHPTTSLRTITPPSTNQGQGGSPNSNSNSNTSPGQGGTGGRPVMVRTSVSFDTASPKGLGVNPNPGGLPLDRFGLGQELGLVVGAVGAVGPGPGAGPAQCWPAPRVSACRQLQLAGCGEETVTHITPGNPPARKKRLVTDDME